VEESACTQGVSIHIASVCTKTKAHEPLSSSDVASNVASNVANDVASDVAGYALAHLAVIAHIGENNRVVAEECYLQALEWLPERLEVSYTFALAELYWQWFKLENAKLEEAKYYYKQTIDKGEYSNRPDLVRRAYQKLCEMDVQPDLPEPCAR
jgi:hypothetical protein